MFKPGDHVKVIEAHSFIHTGILNLTGTISLCYVDIPKGTGMPYGVELDNYKDGHDLKNVSYDQELLRPCKEDHELWMREDQLELIRSAQDVNQDEYVCIRPFISKIYPVGDIRNKLTSVGQTYTIYKRIDPETVETYFTFFTDTGTKQVIHESSLKQFFVLKSSITSVSRQDELEEVSKYWQAQDQLALARTSDGTEIKYLKQEELLAKWKNADKPISDLEDFKKKLCAAYDLPRKYLWPEGVDIIDIPRTKKRFLTIDQEF
jgi:hypothetical protein